MVKLKSKTTLYFIFGLAIVVGLIIYLQPSKKTPDYISSEGYFYTERECESTTRQTCHPAQVDFIPGYKIPSGAYWIADSEFDKQR